MRRTKSSVALVTLLLAFISLFTPHSALAENSTSRLFIDPSIPEVAPLVKCVSSQQLDCIEKVLVEHPNGVIEEAKYVTTRMVDFPSEKGQPIRHGDIIFDFRSGSAEGINKRLRIATHVVTPAANVGLKKAAVYWIMLQRELLPGENSGISKDSPCTETSPLACLNYPALDTQDTFHVYLRTSWLSPVSASGIGIGFNLDYRYIKGGMQWHFSGSEFLQPMFSDVSKLTESIKIGNENMKPDKLNPSLYFALDHGGKDLSDSYWDPSCMEYGFTRTMFNAPLAGQLTWDYATSSLNFNIYAPHLDPFGKVNTGAFHTKFPKAWLDCRFPNNTLSSATKIMVQVVNQDGIPQLATTSHSIRNGFVDIKAYGFHFSSPKILAKRASDSGIDTAVQLSSRDDWENDVQVSEVPTVANKTAQVPLVSEVSTVSKAKVIATKKTITCTKGKLTKKVNGLAPKCPVGYKKK